MAFDPTQPVSPHPTEPTRQRDPREHEPMDSVNWQIIQALQENARLSFVELGRRIGLTPPAVAERVRKLEDAGIITGYHAQIDLARIGLPLLAFIHLRTPADNYPSVLALAAEMAEVLECHHVTGSDAFIIKVAAASISHLEEIIQRLSPYGQTNSTLALSSPVVKQGVVWAPPGAAQAE